MKRWIPEIGLAASLIGLSPLLALQCVHLWERPHFQFFPLAWLAFVVLAVSRAEVVWTQSRTRARLGLGVWGLGLVLGVGAAFRFSPWLAHAAAILCVTGWGLLRLETGAWARWLGWTLLLWVTLPLPGRFDRLLVDGLQELSSKSASALLDLIGLAHLRQGNLIEVRSGKLFVDEACSGIDSLYALFAIALVMMLYKRLPFVIGLFTLATVPVWAWLANVARLTLIVWLLDRWQIDLSHGWQHTVLGLVMFVFASACLFVTLGAFTALFQRFSTAALPRDRKTWHLAYNAAVCFPGKAPEVLSEEDAYFRSSRNDSARKGQAAARRLRVFDPADRRVLLRTLFVTASLASVLIMALSVSALARSRGDLLGLPHYSTAQVDAAFSEAAMPETLHSAQRVAFTGQVRAPDNFNGEYSRIWKYRDSRHEFALSVDFPFRGFHPLWVCYTNVGNVVDGEPVIHKQMANEGAQPGGEGSIARFKLIDEFGTTSYVWFSLFDPSGHPVPIEDYSPDVKNLLVNRLLGRNGLSSGTEPVTFQFQLYLQSTSELTEAELQRYLEIYNEALPHAVEQVKQLSTR